MALEQLSEEPMASPQTIYTAMVRLAAKLAEKGIHKGQRHEQGWMYRGIEDILNGVGQLMPQEQIVPIPTVRSHQMADLPARSGTPMVHVVMSVDYEFVHAPSGTSVHALVYGEGRDQADNATAKAMTDAYKSALTQIFCIPFGEETDVEDPPRGKNAQAQARQGWYSPQGSPDPSRSPNVLRMPDAVPKQYEAEITAILRQQGKTKKEIEQYWAERTAKYGDKLPAMLESFVKEMRERARQKMAAAAPDAPAPWAKD